MKKIIAILLLILLFPVSAIATVSAGESIRQYFTTNGSITEFTFTQPVNSADDVLVYTQLHSTGVQTLLTVDTSYTIAATGGDYLNGGVVTISPAVESTSRVVIVRSIKQSQETTGGAVTPLSIIAVVDKITRQVQDLYDLSDRSIHLQQADPDISMEMPPISEGYLFINDTNVVTIVTNVNPGNVNISTFAETYLDDSTALHTMATLQGRPVINIMNPAYGVTGGGVTDDTASLNSILATVADGDTVVFPKGTYLCDNLATLSNLDDVIFIGYGAVIKAPLTETAGAGFSFDTCTFITIEGFEFDRRNSFIADNLMNGIQFSESSDCVVKRCIFDECFAGVFTTGTANNRIQVTRCTMVGRLDYSASNDTNKILCFKVASFQATTDTDCEVSFCRSFQAGIYFGSGNVRTLVIGNVGRESNDSTIYNSGGERVRIIGNTVINAGRDAIKSIAGSSFSVIANNQVSGTGVEKTGGGVGVNVIGNHSTVTGNEIQIPTPSNGGVTHSGMTIQGEGHAITGNDIAGAGAGELQTGIIIRNSDVDTSNCLISGNNMNSLQTGIHLNLSDANNTFTDVVVEGNFITGMTRSGIRCDGDASLDMNDIAIRDNTIKDVVEAGIEMDFQQRPIVINNRVYGTAKRSYRILNSDDLVFKGNTQDGAATLLRVNLTGTNFFVETFTESDQTPAVGAGGLFLTFAGTLTITDLDESIAGEIYTIISKAAITFDVTSTNLKGGTADIVTASGDVTRWVGEDGTTLRLISWMDVSQDNKSNGIGLYGQ